MYFVFLPSLIVRSCLRIFGILYSRFSQFKFALGLLHQVEVRSTFKLFQIFFIQNKRQVKNYLVSQQNHIFSPHIEKILDKMIEPRMHITME